MDEHGANKHNQSKVPDNSTNLNIDFIIILIMFKLLSFDWLYIVTLLR